jgi:hypothetical protein
MGINYTSKSKKRGFILERYYNTQSFSKNQTTWLSYRLVSRNFIRVLPRNGIFYSQPGSPIRPFEEGTVLTGK